MTNNIEIHKISKWYYLIIKKKFGIPTNFYICLNRLPREFFIIKRNDEKVGVISLRDIRKKVGLAEITISLFQKFRNQGIGTIAISLIKEEAKKRNIKTLIAYVQSNNLQSLKIFCNNGFIQSTNIPVESNEGNLIVVWTSTKTSEEILFQNEKMQLPLHLDGFGEKRLSELVLAILTKEGDLYDWLENKNEEKYRLGGIYLGNRLIDKELINYLMKLFKSEFKIGTEYLITSKVNPNLPLLEEITSEYSIHIVFIEDLLNNLHKNQKILTYIRHELKLKVLYDLELRKCL